jgi:hypothetical protein
MEVGNKKLGSMETTGSTVWAWPLGCRASDVK